MTFLLTSEKVGGDCENVYIMREDEGRRSSVIFRDHGGVCEAEGERCVVEDFGTEH